MMNKTSTHVWQKWFKKIVFPFRFPVPEKVFDSWYDTLDTASRNLYLASLPYFWFNKAPFVERICETFLYLALFCLLVGQEQIKIFCSEKKTEIMNNK